MKHDSQAATSHADARGAAAGRSSPMRRRRRRDGRGSRSRARNRCSATMMATSSPRIVRHAAAALARTGDPAAVDALDGSARAERRIRRRRASRRRLEIALRARTRRRQARRRRPGQSSSTIRTATIRIDAATPARACSATSARPTRSRSTSTIRSFTSAPRSSSRYAADPRGDQGVPDGARRSEGERRRQGDRDDRARLRGRRPTSCPTLQQAARRLALQRRSPPPRSSTAHDAKARPALIKQLQVSALRVQAARWLRHLDAEPDPDAVAAAARRARDAAGHRVQVGAAETLLLLAGPVEWSKYE